MSKHKTEEIRNIFSINKPEKGGQSAGDVSSILRELDLKQRELEDKNRELFIIKQELDSCNAKYEKVYENSPSGYFTFNNSGTILKLNTTGAEQLGTKKELLVHKSFIDFVVPEHRARFQMHLENIFTYKKRHGCEVKIERKDKSLFYALIESIPTNGYGGNYLTCESSVSDITMLKVAEDALKESEARFQSMANTAPVLIWITDTDALFNFVNNVWLQYTGRTLGQELGMGWIENIHPDDLNPYLQIYKSSFDARLPFEVEFRIKKYTGQYRWIISKGVPRFHSDGRFAGFIGSCTDINDQKEIEDTILGLNEKLKSLNTSKDKFFSIIAHDLKSPLSGLLGFAEILVEEYDELPDEEKKEFIGHTYDAAKNIMALLENLLEWSRIQSGSIVFTPETLNVESVLDDIFGLFAQNARNKNIKLEKNIDSSTMVFVDKNMFHTILRNLVSNGIKFTNDGGSIVVSAKMFPKFVEISVKDSGVGISEANLQKLFKIDTSFSTQGTNKERGTGLGLMLCKELVEKNGGKIKVESELGKGTTFVINLPKGKDY
ncbi:MAG: PAS domain-containing sensor histidine kinase [Ignavibacteriaceae bacterium]|nr:PAS domain-containing sensor histidine kinase [Ignavibacteriaceae bacterium]